MKREDILKKVESAGGSWNPTKNIEITDPGKANDIGGVHISVSVGDKKIRFWLMNHHQELSEAILSGTYKANAAEELIKGLRIFAAFAQIKISDSKVVEVETIDPVDKKQEDEFSSGNETATNLLYRAEGKVEAYEKILIGRQITASK
jgi:hypothetical protein